MKNKKLLAIILLSLSFCFVSGVGSLAVFAQVSPLAQVYAEHPPTEPVSGTESALAQRAKYVKRRTFLVFFINEKEGVLSMLWKFLDMYQDAEIPEEFGRNIPSGINDVDKLKRARWSGDLDFMFDIGPKDFILSLLLTMAYQQGYKIEHVTSSYMILQKFVDKEELKEWEERSNGYKEKGDK